MKIIRQYPFTTYGILALFIEALLIASGAQYADSGLAGMLVLTTPLWGAVFWMPREMLLTLHHGVALKGQGILSAVIGLGFCLLADYLLKSAGRKWGGRQ